MNTRQKHYDIKELCEQVIKELHKHLKDKYSWNNMNIKEKNNCICKWIDRNYNSFFKSYVKDHPIK